VLHFGYGYGLTSTRNPLVATFFWTAGNPPAAKPAPKSQASAVDGHWSLSSGWATMGVLYPGYTHPGQLWCPTAGVACDRHTGAAAAWTIPESKAGQAR
jgi:hypothetical protein